MSLNLAQLRAFVAVVEAGGFGAAAPALGISQSAVSHAVAALERTVGRPVIRRDGATSRPTAFGMRLLDHARTAVAAAEAITGLAAEAAGGPSGTIRLGTVSTVCLGLLPRLLAGWRAEFPAVSVRVFEGDDDEVADWLAARTVEAAILVDPPRTTGVQVGSDEFHALLPADHPLAAEPVIDAADLADDPFLLSLGGCEPHVEEVHRRAGVPLRPTHRVRELSTLVAMVRAGLGVSVVPGLAAAMLDEGLVLVPLRQRLHRRLILTGPLDRPWHPAVTALVESV
ncbi:LysR family transcriptional regulator [Amycolatopsis suaedae]|uniref:LysR family transcriptional regulator n=1 Tax=Amycolatopsis suaedae TaxID=2510978 RepID=A0A4Q7IYK2_9PSEU|nr:LysR family transcriptional regulator [Amycolatopsis suaedae]RZQ59342.1 LysR family transcriptional regulator [Amycolatopsis suaedae]